MKLEQSLRETEYREILPHFLRVFLPLTLLILSAVVVYFVIDTRHEVRLILAGQAQQLKLSQQSLQRDIAGVSNELRYLASSDSLGRFISSGDNRVRADAEKDVARFAQHIGRYDQIRWLDLKGMERLRVDHRNGATHIIPPQQLQDKSKRYYFIEAIQRLPGEIYLSPLDLNIEHGEVEIPYRPMLRFATPTMDGQGVRNGLLIFNYQASLMLDNFAHSKYGGPSELSLLNPGGYWLFSHDTAREWGFMLGREERFQGHYPDAWKAIGKQPHGTVTTDNGLFSFTTIEPLMDHGSGMTAVTHSRYSNQLETPRQRVSWIIVSRYPRGALDALYHAHLGLYGGMLCLALLVLGVISWKMARTVGERNRLMDRLALHAKVMETATNGVMITDSEPRIVAINQAFTDLTGYSSKEVLGKEPTILASGRHEADYYTAMWQALEEKDYWEGEIWNRHKNGQLFPEWLSISAVRHRDGALANYIGIFSVLSEQKSTEARLRELANADPLTGLLNRNLLYDRAGQALAQSRRTGNKDAFLFLDLDGFKPINDSLGHAAGDMVLKEVAKRLEGCVRESDTVARFGGDEFVVLLTGVKGRGEVAAVGEKILTAIQRGFTVAAEECHVGMSIGVSLYPEDGESVEVLLKRADEAMYHAKQAGGGHVEFYHGG